MPETYSKIRLLTKDAAWHTTNAALVLGAGRVVFLSGTNPMKWKVGDGATTLVNLKWQSGYLDTLDIVTPEGTDRDTAYEIVSYDNVIDDCDGTAGVAFTSADKGFRAKIRNAHETNGLPVYPKEGANFLGLAEDEPFIVAALNAFEFVCYEDNEYRNY